MVLCDVVMPGIGGRELTDHLISLHPEMKVLYMSGYTENAIVHHGVMGEGDELHPEALYRGWTDKKSERSVEPVTAALEMWLENKMSSDQP